MSLSPSAKLLLSKHPEIIKELIFEYGEVIKPERSLLVEAEIRWTNFVQKQAEPKRDYVVVTFEHPGQEMWNLDMETGQYSAGGSVQFDLEYLLRSGSQYKIHTVIRLSDKEKFSIREKVIQGCSFGFIESMTESWVGLEVQFEGGGACKLSELKKSKPALLITEDGKSIFEDDDFWSINSDFEIRRWTATKYNTSRWADGVHLFSTQELCKEYMLTNKPCLSVNDIKSFSTATVYSIVGDAMKELVKQKSTHA